MDKRPCVHLIDAHYQIFRAYHGLPDLRVADPKFPNGRPVGALRGYAQLLLRYLREREPTHIAAAWDFALTSFRNELYPGYKRGRTEAPADLAIQLGPCEAVTAALGIPVFKMERYEADDVLATLVRQLVAQGSDVLVVSADKDLAALVGEQVWLVDPRDGTRAGPEQVQARLGVPPSLVPDYLALVGDAVDGVPGVKGIGPRTARALLGCFGGIDRIPDDADAWPELGLRGARSIAARLRESRAELALWRDLVRMREDLPLAVSLAALAYRGARRTALADVLDAQGAGSLLARVAKFA
jgi:DNA polymerase-1